MNMNIWGVCFVFDLEINQEVGEKMEKVGNV